MVMMLKAITPEGWNGVVIAKLPNFTAAAPATKQDQCDFAQPAVHEQQLGSSIELAYCRHNE